MKKNYFMKSIAAALLTGVVAMGGLTSCASDDDAVEQKPEVKPETFTYHVNIPATFGGDTRAVTFTDATTSSSYFEANAKIYAYLVPVANSLTAGYWSTAAPLTVSASSKFNVDDDTYTALTGDMTFTVEPQVNDEIILNYGINKDNTTDGDNTNNDRGRYYFDYTDQTGTAASASAHDFASDRMKITAISGSEITLVRSENTSSSVAVFKNLQSMFRLVPSFTDGGTAVSPAPTIVSLKIEALDGNNNQKLATTCYQGGRTSDYMVLNTNFSTDPIYLALGFVSTTTKLKLTATDNNGKKYVCEKSTSFTNGKYYSGNAVFEAYVATGHALSASVVGDIVCSDGLAYDVTDKNNLPTGVTPVAVLGYINGSDHYAIALQDAEVSATWYTITNNGINKNGDCEVPSKCNWSVAAPTGTSWVVAAKDTYSGIFQGLGSTEYSNGYTYDSKSNACLTTVGGTALSGFRWSTSERDGYYGWYFVEEGWINDPDKYSGYDKNHEFRVRPVLKF